MTRQQQKYLRTRAIVAPWQLEGSERSDYRAAIVIPALAERESLPQPLASLASNPAEDLNQTLIVVVVNNRSVVSDGQFQDNQKTLAWLRSKPCPQLNLAWIDASSAGLELADKEGVGLARKIGLDLALSQLDWRQKPLLISLDADTLVDENYLPAIFGHFKKCQCGGATLPFRHQSAADPRQEAAIRHYELYLRSYLFGLQQVGSPYAYHSIGSAFACRAEAYIAAGGMNRRPAAEDFYFLQQLAKTGRVEMLSGTVVQPSPRFSRRVPFGTGQAVQGQVEEGLQAFQFSSAPAFSILRQWLSLVAGALARPADVVQSQAAEFSPVLQQFLIDLDFTEVWARLQENHSASKNRLQAFHGWFDGLRTRQLLTRLDAGREQPVADLVAGLLAWGGYPGVGRAADQLLLLEQLQQVEKRVTSE